mmetsp:Transcript_53054/g.152941  ORF Transcript_53054/g.152941 Transcript_53054/m.152941 type:complete len:216 (+) Transcript_53054:848-1495(+)
MDTHMSTGSFRSNRRRAATSSAVWRLKGRATSPATLQCARLLSGSSSVPSSCHEACGGWNSGFSLAWTYICTAGVSFRPWFFCCSNTFATRWSVVKMSSVRFLTPSNMLKLDSMNSGRSRTPSPFVSAAAKAASSIQPSSRSSLTSTATTFCAAIHSSGDKLPSPDTSNKSKMCRSTCLMPAWYRGPIRARSVSAILTCLLTCSTISFLFMPISV